MRFPYFSFDEVPVLWTVDFFIFQEAAVALAGTHEVVVTGARGKAAANGGSRLLTLLTPLKQSTNCKRPIKCTEKEWKIIRN